MEDLASSVTIYKETRGGGGRGKPTRGHQRPNWDQGSSLDIKDFDRVKVDNGGFIEELNLAQCKISKQLAATSKTKKSQPISLDVQLKKDLEPLLTEHLKKLSLYGNPYLKGEHAAIVGPAHSCLTKALRVPLGDIATLCEKSASLTDILLEKTSVDG